MNDYYFATKRAAYALFVFVLAAVSAAVIGWTRDPGTITAANKVVNCASAEQLLQQYAKNAGSSFDALKCKSITATDLTHWVAIVSITLGGITRDWTVSISTNGVQIASASPLPTS